MKYLEPHAPSNVKFYMKNNSTEVVLTWSSNVKGKFLVEYGVFDDYTATKKSIFTSLTTTTIKGLSIGNTYAVRILIHSSPYGRSTFSTPVMITMPPGNTPSSFTKIKGKKCDIYIFNGGRGRADLDKLPNRILFITLMLKFVNNDI